MTLVMIIIINVLLKQLERIFTCILLKKILSQMLSLRMTPLLTSAPFLLAAKLSSQRFSGVFAWLKICGKDNNPFWL